MRRKTNSARAIGPAVAQRGDGMPSLVKSLILPYLKPKKQAEEPLPEAGLEEEGFTDVLKPYKKAALQKLRERGVPEEALVAADMLTPDSPLDFLSAGKQPDVSSVRRIRGKTKVSDLKMPPAGKVELPPAQNAQKTQIAGTLPTYAKAQELFSAPGEGTKSLDFGAGLGKGAELMKADSYEPFPRTGFNPTYTDASGIPDKSYSRVTNLNVLNVVPKETRDGIVKDIGRVLSPGGEAIITTRGRDVLTAKGADGPEAMSRITTAGTYQKGFTPSELREYIQETLGDEFTVQSVKLGPAGVKVIRKTKE